jgi:hypothetical protein
MKKLLLALSASALLFSGCNTESEKPNRIPTPGHYVNAAVGLDLAYPTAWQAKLDQNLNGTQVDLLLIDQQPLGGFSPNLTVIIVIPSGSTSLNSILTESEEALRAHFPDLSQYHDSISVRDGKEVASLEYEVTSGGALLHFLQYIFLNNKRAVIMTFSDRADHFPNNADIAGMRNSFSITPK